MAIDHEKLLEFAEHMQTDLVIDPEKEKWDKAQDPWWYFGMIAKNINQMEEAMAAKEDIVKLAVSTSNYIFIVQSLYTPKKKVTKKKRKASKKKTTKKKTKSLL